MILMKKHVAAILIIIIAAVLAVVGIKKYAARQTFSEANVKIVLDAGHGEPDGGAVGVTGAVEKDINFDIVMKIDEILRSNGMDVILTRSTDSAIYDKDAKTIREKYLSDMRKRREIIRKSGADLFLSIHMNAFGDPTASGLHIFYDKQHGEIKRLAENMQEGISKITKAKTNCVQTVDERLFLMKNPVMPSILAECGFLSNPEEEQKLMDEEYRSKIAWAIAQEVVKYYEME